MAKGLDNFSKGVIAIFGGKEAAEKADQNWQNFQNGVADKVNQAGQWVNDRANDVGTWANNTYESVSTGISNGLDAAGQWCTDTYNGAKQGLQDMGNAYMEAQQRQAEMQAAQQQAMYEAGKQAWENTKQFASDTYNGVKQNVTEAGTYFDAAWQESNTKKVVDGVTTAGKQAVDATVDFGHSAEQWVGDRAKDVGTFFENVGNGIEGATQGFKDGFSGANRGEADAAEMLGNIQGVGMGIAKTADLAVGGLGA